MIVTNSRMGGVLIMTNKKQLYRLCSFTVALVVLCCAILVFELTAYATETDSYNPVIDNSIISISFPEEFPFTIVVPDNGDPGFIYSDDFFITNNGKDPVSITMDNIRVIIDGMDEYKIAHSNNLPEYGNNIHFVLICTQNSNSARYILTEKPQTTYTYLLESGETASFRISGSVNQFSETSWDEATVTIAARFVITHINETYEAEDKQNENIQQEPNIEPPQEPIITDSGDTTNTDTEIETDDKNEETADSSDNSDTSEEVNDDIHHSTSDDD